MRRRAGHGSDDQNCAEFCVTSHTFLVNGVEHTAVFREAGTEWGCADRARAPSLRASRTESSVLRGLPEQHVSNCRTCVLQNQP